MKHWIIIAVALILIGAAITFTALCMAKWDFRNFDNTIYETVTHEPAGDLQNISISSSEADVILRPAEDGTLRVVCHENVKVPHTVTLVDGTLTVKSVDNRAWYDHIQAFSFDTPKITVYLPDDAYGDLALQGSTGDADIPSAFSFTSITVQRSTGDVICRASSETGITISVSTGDILLMNATASEITLRTTTGDVGLSRVSCSGRVALDVDTGDVTATDLSCGAFSSEGTTGDVELTHVIVSQTMRLSRSTGDIEIEGCDAAELYIETDTGDVDGFLLSPKTFLAESASGSVKVPPSATGGRCEIRTNTGDIFLQIQN